MSAVGPVARDRVAERIAERLAIFRLPTAAAEMAPRLIAAGHADALPTVLEVCELEAEERHDRRVQRLRRAARLPPGKTLATFDDTRLPPALARKLKELAQGQFVEQCLNVLAFGLPGTGKSHAACALGHALVEAGRAVFFTPTYALVQDLLAAKRDLALSRALRKLDHFDALILDDLGYVQQGPTETEVLFTLMSERYERRSMIITSNLVFSQWDQIFKNPMTTASAIDRVVHHSVILEFDVPSYRTEKAQKQKRGVTTKKAQTED